MGGSTRTAWERSVLRCIASLLAGVKRGGNNCDYPRGVAFLRSQEGFLQPFKVAGVVPLEISKNRSGISLEHSFRNLIFIFLSS